MSKHIIINKFSILYYIILYYIILLVSCSSPSTIKEPSKSSPPRAVNLTPNTTSFAVNWEPPKDDGGETITKYTIKWGNKPGIYSGEKEISKDTKGTIENLLSGLAYYVVITATNSVGESLPSTEHSAAALNKPSAPIVKKTFPSLSVLKQQNRIPLPITVYRSPDDDASKALTMYWKATLNDPTRNVAANVSPISGSISFIAGERSREFNVVLLFKSNFKEDQLHITILISITAGKDTGDDFTTTFNLNVPDTPAAPHNVNLKPKTKSITVNWDIPKYHGSSSITKYTVKWGSTSKSYTKTQNISPEERNYTIPALMTDTEYHVIVTAANSVGESLPSAELSATPN